MIDTHTHLNFSDLEWDIDNVLAEAKQAGVSDFIVPGTNLNTSKSALEMAKKYTQVYAAAGIHPTDTDEYEGETIKEFKALVSDKNIVSIGEVGLDYYHFPKYIDRQGMEKIKARQAFVFNEMIDIGLEKDLPLIIHSREAFEDTYDILKRVEGRRVVIHCFSGSVEEAQSWLALGFHLSFTGMITYKRNGDLRTMIRELPLDRIMIETDSPYLAPEGFRGQICKPAYVKQVAQCITDIKNINFEEVDRITTATAKDFFKI